MSSLDHDQLLPANVGPRDRDDTIGLKPRIATAPGPWTAREYWNPSMWDWALVNQLVRSRFVDPVLSERE